MLNLYCCVVCSMCCGCCVYVSDICSSDKWKQISADFQIPEIRYRYLIYLIYLIQISDLIRYLQINMPMKSGADSEISDLSASDI